MKTFTDVGAQGDLLLVRVERLPDGLSIAATDNGAFVLAHSETGHNHVVMERPGVRFYSAMDQLRAMLDGAPVGYLVIDDEPADVEHLRAHDTHETLRVGAGIYEVRRQREYTPEGWARAAD